VSATVVIALHDGYFSAGSGAGRSNRALINAAAGVLAPDVELVVLPVMLHPGSPEYDPAGHQAIDRRLAAVAHHVISLDNGTAGMRRFGGLSAFKHLDRDAASVLNQLMRRHAPGLLIAIDQPFAGLGPLLDAPARWRLLYLPRSAASHHGNAEAAAWEQDGLAGWTAKGASFGAISAHMRALLMSSGIPARQILDIPGGLTADDDVPLTLAPPLPEAAEEKGFLLAMGRAQPYKGFEDLLDALSLLVDQHHQLPHLLLAAVTEGTPGPYQRHLGQRITALRLEATLWTRFDASLPGLLHHPKLRAVIVPSRTEPLGRIPLEAFAAGAAPVVATTAGGLAETVIDGVTGFTAPPADAQALARAIHRALTATPEQVERLRTTGAATAAARDYTTCITGMLTVLAPWAAAAKAVKP
jgi:glycosyltransferase involved in cell wall biosynthesis